MQCSDLSLLCALPPDFPQTLFVILLVRICVGHYWFVILLAPGAAKDGDDLTSEEEQQVHIRHF